MSAQRDPIRQVATNYLAFIKLAFTPVAARS
jgi:hypothetical protein